MHGRTLSDGETVVEVGGQWIGPGQHRMIRLLSRARARDVPDLQRGREHPALRRRRRRRYKGAIPRINPLTLADMAQAQTALRPARPPGAARGAVDRATAPTSGTRSRSSPGSSAQRPHREGAEPAPPLLRGGVRRRAAGLLAAARALLHALRRGRRRARRGARTARSRTATSAVRSSCPIAHGRGARRRTSCGSARRCGASSSAATS